MGKQKRFLLVLPLVFLLLFGCLGADKKAPGEALQPATGEAKPGLTPLGADSILDNSEGAIQSAFRSPALKAPRAEATRQGQFSIIWMSDPQFYSEDHPEIFNCMTEWIKENVDALQIKYVVITGDFVNHTESDREWGNAIEALSRLEGVVPVLTVAGNHDLSSRDGGYDRYLNYLGNPISPGLTTVEDVYREGRGRCDLLDAGGREYMLLSLGYSVDDEGIAWLNRMLAKYPNRQAILCVHGYLDPDGSYTTDGSRLAGEVVAKNANIRLVLCGHRYGVYHQMCPKSQSQGGAQTAGSYELVADYQEEANGGNGYLCVLTFDEETGDVHVTTYSPWLDDYNCFEDSTGREDYTLDLQSLN